MTKITEGKANRIRELRKARGLSLKALAERVGDSTHFTTISKLERGEMALTTAWMTKISLALGVAVLELIDEDTGYSSINKLPVTLVSEEHTAEDKVIGAWFHSPFTGDNYKITLPMTGLIDKFFQPNVYFVVDTEDRSLTDGAFYWVISIDSEIARRANRPHEVAKLLTNYVRYSEKEGFTPCGIDPFAGPKFNPAKDVIMGRVVYYAGRLR